MTRPQNWGLDVSRRSLVGAALGAVLTVPTYQVLAASSKRPLLPRPQPLPPGRMLTAQRGRFPFLLQGDGGYGYNGSSPGPLIRVRRGEKFRVRVANALPVETTFHWHGLVAPTVFDGQPQNPLAPGEEREIAFPIVQRASMNWYHPHPHGNSAEQAWHGLGGLFIIEDEEEAALGLPSGEDELFLTLRDIELGPLDKILYPADADGTEGRIPMINGVVYPRVLLRNRQIRVRILNAANARAFNLTADAGMTLIGNDGGLLEAPVAIERVMMGPAERIDLILDLRHVAPGGIVVLKDPAFSEPLLQIEVVEGAADPWEIPSRLSTIEKLVHEGDEPDRLFTFQGQSMINGQSFEPKRIDFATPLGKVERWRFRAARGGPHPIHIHGTHFQLLERRVERERIEPWERGWKDTFQLVHAEQIDILIRFNEYEGGYLLHCHKLEHEDGGIMLNFAVGKDPEKALALARSEAMFGSVPLCSPT